MESAETSQKSSPKIFFVFHHFVWSFFMFNLYYTIRIFLLLIIFSCIIYYLIRAYIFKKTNISDCPKCHHKTQRIKRKSIDRFWSTFFNLPLQKFKCEYFACNFEGLRIASSTTNRYENYKRKTPIFFDSEKSLIRSLDNNEICLYYQPKFNLKSNKITGMEALLRWDHPIAGLISPSFFIEEIENNKFIITIGEFLIEKICDQLKLWHEKGIENLDISVNLSSNQFYNKNLIKKISQILEDVNLNPSFLDIEIDEKTLIRDTNKSKKIICGLRDIGVNISIDNFSLEKSSIFYLRELPLTSLKIDRIWIQNLQQGTQRDIHILESFMSLGKALNLNIVAMGVETDEQLKILNNSGCDIIQGFIIKPALSVEESTIFLQEIYSNNKRDKILSGAF